MPMPSAAPKKKKATSTGDSRPSGEYGYDESGPAASRAPQIPIMALPGMSKVRTPEELTREQLKERSEMAAPSEAVTGTHEPERASGVEETVEAVAPSLTERRPASQRGKYIYTL